MELVKTSRTENAYFGWVISRNGNTIEAKEPVPDGCRTMFEGSYTVTLDSDKVSIRSGQYSKEKHDCDIQLTPTLITVKPHQDRPYTIEPTTPLNPRDYEAIGLNIAASVTGVPLFFASAAAAAAPQSPVPAWIDLATLRDTNDTHNERASQQFICGQDAAGNRVNVTYDRTAAMFPNLGRPGLKVDYVRANSNEVMSHDLTKEEAAVLAQALQGKIAAGSRLAMEALQAKATK